MRKIELLAECSNGEFRKRCSCPADIYWSITQKDMTLINAISIIFGIGKDNDVKLFALRHHKKKPDKQMISNLVNALKVTSGGNK